MSRQALPKRLEKEIYQQFNSRCPFCDESDVATLQVHHIEPYAKVKSHTAANLILVCSNCHQKIEAGKIDKQAVLDLKQEAIWGGITMTKKPDSNDNIISIGGSVSNGIVANTLVINSTGKAKSPTIVPTGSIAENVDQRNYIKYLIDRYHEFKKAEVGKDKMRYPVFYNAIKREFGAKWNMIRSDRFDAVAQFIQKRIDLTVVGKKQKSKGQRNFSSFEDFLKK
ncbi:MAG: HNH endonuclease [Cohaesibacter sp.]|nr:HNH endonuclease [Cohaesibacter sp.]